MSTILLVDDEPLVARLHAHAVRAAGFEPLVAADGESALELLADAAPQLVITDMNMPGMSGFELTQNARSLGYDRPIILLSGDDHVRLLIEGLGAGIDDFIVKGMSFATLAALLQFWARGPFRRLPESIRSSALDYFSMAWPLGPPIAQLRRDLSVLEARALATLKDLLLHAPEDFGKSHANHVRLLGVASGILTTLTRSDPLARLRLPELLYKLLALHPPTQLLLETYEALHSDATFQHAQETLRLL
jgi:DNA-binding response OmpR family regulator